MLYLPCLSLRGSWREREGLTERGEDVKTTVAELSVLSVVSLLSV